MVSFERVAAVLGAMLLAVVSWLSSRTLDRIDTLSGQVQTMSAALLQVPQLDDAVRDHDHRLTVLEAHASRGTNL